MWKSARGKALDQIRRRWAKPRIAGHTPHGGQDAFSFHHIEAFADRDRQPGWHRLNAQTQNDIDFKELFFFVDHTNSRIGQQFLYNRLLKPHGQEAPLLDLDRQARFFSANTSKREQVQLNLRRLDHPDAYHVQLLLDDGLFTRPAWYGFAIADTVIVILLLLLSLFYPVALISLLLPFAINLVLHFRNKNHTYRFIKAFPQLKKMMKVVSRLAATGIPFEGAAVAKSLSRLKGFSRKSRYLSFGQTGGSELAMLYYWLFELVKIMFLVELHNFFLIMRELDQKKADVKTLLTYIGSIDMAISIASLRAGTENHCIPNFLPPSQTLTVNAAYHPLIPGCVVNSLAIEAKGVLITGSNMSGKTTFLRTLGINTLLAQTIATCCAANYSAPFLKLFSSIRIDDSLLEGKSYYFEEVTIMGELIAAGEPHRPNLYLLDEVFKGTNMVERIAAAKAILTWFNRGGHLVVVSTHDLELSDMLKERYDLYHFEETLQDGKLLFDHQLKPGPLQTRNAIRILEMAGYPQAIIDDAQKTSRDLSSL